MCVCVCVHVVCESTRCGIRLRLSVVTLQHRAHYCVLVLYLAVVPFETQLNNDQPDGNNKDDGCFVVAMVEERTIGCCGDGWGRVLVGTELERCGTLQTK